MLFFLTCRVIFVYNTLSGKCVETVDAHMDAVTALVFVPLVQVAAPTARMFRFHPLVYRIMYSYTHARVRYIFTLMHAHVHMDAVTAHAVVPLYVRET